MKILLRALFLCIFTLSLNAQPYSLTIGNYSLNVGANPNPVAYDNLEQPAVINGVVTIAVTTNNASDGLFLFMIIIIITTMIIITIIGSSS